MTSNNILRGLIFLVAISSSSGYSFSSSSSIKNSSSSSMIGLWLLLLPAVTAFAPSSPLISIRHEGFGFSSLTPHPSKFQLRASMNNNNGNADASSSSSGDNFDLESARQRLENMMDNSGSYNNRGDDTSAVADKLLLPSIALFNSNNNKEKKKNNNKHPNTTPQLTAIARVRKTAEIQLLSQLEQHAVEAADALNALWLNERGSRAAKELKKADAIFQQGESSWNKAEDSFLTLIHEYGPYWVEPLHRLAMLYYLQGRLEEAKELEEFVLHRKPWHIGSLSNYVRIAESQHDTKRAVKWAARRLPPDGKRRGRWVEHAVHTAINQLSRDERRLRAFFGKLAVAAAAAPEDQPWQ